MSAAECVVVGAGLAGCSTAWHLAVSGPWPAADVVLVEREEQPGTHASAQNAAMVRGLVERADLRAPALDGVAFWNAPPPALRLPAGAFRRTGSLLLARRADTCARLDEALAAAGARGLPVRRLEGAELEARFPFVAGLSVRAGYWSGADGVADPHALIRAFVTGFQAAGGRILTGTAVRRVLAAEGRVAGVEFADGSRVASPRVVLAPGAWHGTLLEASGFPPRGAQPYRRHLFVTERRPATLGRDFAGFVWDLDAGVYFRPEGPGLLCSACDEDPCPPGRPAPAEGILEWAAARFAPFPWLGELPITRLWAGLRTIARGRGFLLGPDPEVPGLFHAAALGGHGVTCAGPVGRAVAAALSEARAAESATDRGGAGARDRS